MRACLEGQVEGLDEGKRRETWSPSWAPHITGTYDVRTYDPETGVPDEQRVDIRCGSCGSTHRVVCRTGHVREHVATFARVHAHRDPLQGLP